MDRQHSHPNYQEHHEDPLKKLLYPLMLALKRTKPRWKKLRFFSEAGKHSLGEENQKQQILPSKFTPLGESIQFAEVQTQEKMRNQNPTSAVLSLISTSLKNSQEQQRNPRCLKQFYCDWGSKFADKGPKGFLLLNVISTSKPTTSFPFLQNFILQRLMADPRKERSLYSKRWTRMPVTGSGVTKRKEYIIIALV